MDLTEDPTFDPDERLMLERERQRLARVLYERGLVTTPGPDPDVTVQIVDLQPEDA